MAGAVGKLEFTLLTGAWGEQPCDLADETKYQMWSLAAVGVGATVPLGHRCPGPR